MEILVRFKTCCGINLRTFMRTYLRSEMPHGKMKKKIGTILISASIVLPPYFSINSTHIVSEHITTNYAMHHDINLKIVYKY